MNLKKEKKKPVYTLNLLTENVSFSCTLITGLLCPKTQILYLATFSRHEIRIKLKKKKASVYRDYEKVLNTSWL